MSRCGIGRYSFDLPSPEVVKCPVPGQQVVLLPSVIKLRNPSDRFLNLAQVCAEQLDEQCRRQDPDSFAVGL